MLVKRGFQVINLDNVTRFYSCCSLTDNGEKHEIIFEFTSSDKSIRFYFPDEASRDSAMNLILLEYERDIKLVDLKFTEEQEK